MGKQRLHPCELRHRPDVYLRPGRLGATIGGTINWVTRFHCASALTARRSRLSPPPSCRTKLASLFGLDQESSQGNESFQYTAPKQPRKSNSTGRSTRKLHMEPGCGGSAHFLSSPSPPQRRQPARSRPRPAELRPCCLPQRFRPSDSEHDFLIFYTHHTSSKPRNTMSSVIS